VLWVNGRFVPAEEPAVRADDAGLLFGRGVYDTFRARKGRVFRLEAHVARITAGAKVVGIAMPSLDAEAVVRELCERGGLEDARVRMTLTAGPAGGPPTLVIQARAAVDYPAEMYERGMAALISPVRRNETSPLAGVKSLNCLDNIMSREWAQAQGADTALLLNTRGALAEASTANLFVVREGGLVTPPVRDGALPGVTRGAVLGLAREAGMRAEERSLAPEELVAAAAAFLTGAVMGVMPLVRVDGRPVGEGKPGEVTRRVRELYEAAVRVG
jgi:branched-subunit amino acid aminotransferase/4-amino-4-deoxychorismate lyase